jgi:hypothetical protein
MITISLDEQGAFEQSENSGGNDTVMIAGIVFDDAGDPEEVEREKSRIREFFENVCHECGSVYPNDLHLQPGQGERVSYVARTKEKYRRTLPGFLKDGTYERMQIRSDDGKVRLGTYYVYAMVKSIDGKKQMIRSEVSNLVNDQINSNLYFNMAGDVLSKLLYGNNALADQKEVSLQLATRVQNGFSQELTEYTDVGYNMGKPNDEGRTRVFLTNGDVFRSSLQRDMLLEPENDKTIRKISAEPIRYNNPDLGQEFLYLADAVCTVLGYKVTYDSEGEYLKTTWDRMGNLAGENRLLYVYDDVDTVFARAWRAAKNEDIYAALSGAFDAYRMPGEAAAFYEEVWEPQLMELLKKHTDLWSLTRAIRTFAQSTRSNNLSQEKLVYVFGHLKKLAKKLSKELRSTNPQDQAILYELYDAGASAFNHMGDPKKAGECLKKCEQYAPYVSIDHEIRNRNKAAVQLCDSFRYREAEELVRASYEFCRITGETQKKLFGEDSNYNSSEYAIVCSQMGQVYAYQMDARAEEVFQEALGLLGKGTPNYYITESYLLHYYLEVKDRSSYEHYAEEYFGGNTDLSKQLEYLIREGSVKENPIISMKFALYVFLKAIFTFYLEELPRDLSLKLLDIRAAIEAVSPDGLGQINGHPWEISYKYLAMITASMGMEDISASYEREMEACISGAGGTIGVINAFGALELAKFRNKAGSFSDEQKSRIAEIGQMIAAINPELAGIETYEELERVVTYSYR